MGNSKSRQVKRKQVHRQLLAAIHKGKGANHHCICYKDDRSGKNVQWGWLVVENAVDLPRCQLKFQIEDLEGEALFSSNLIATWDFDTLILRQRDSKWVMEMSLDLNGSGVLAGELMLRNPDGVGCPFEVFLTTVKEEK
jgi:hypothetical protein